MALGATLVALIVTIKETSHVFMNWRTNRLVRRKEKVDALHRDGTHAFMSKRTADAVNLFERALVIDPNRTDSLLWLGNIYRSESNYTEAIRLPPAGPTALKNAMWKSYSNWPRIWKAPRRYEDALQTLQNILRIEPDNLMALIRKTRSANPTGKME
jgi:tetratricopeptide (TPR) repeat protein